MAWANPKAIPEGLGDRDLALFRNSGFHIRIPTTLVKRYLLQCFGAYLRLRQAWSAILAGSLPGLKACPSPERHRTAERNGKWSRFLPAGIRLGGLVTLLSVWMALHAVPAQAGPFAYIPNDGSNTVSVIDTATNTVTATVPVGANPAGVAVHPAGTFVYVANFNDNTVSVIDTATNTVTATVPVGNAPVALGQFIGPLSADGDGDGVPDAIDNCP